MVSPSSQIAQGGMIKVIVVPPFERSYAKLIKPTQDSYRTLVNGEAAGLYFSLEKIPFHCIYRFDGKTTGQPFCRFIGHEPIAGQFFVTKLNPQTSQNYSPTIAELNLLQHYFDIQYDSGNLRALAAQFGKWGLDVK